MVGKTNGIGDAYVYSATSGFVSAEERPVTWMDDYSNVTHDFLVWFMFGFLYGVSSVCAASLIVIGGLCSSPLLMTIGNVFKMILALLLLVYLIAGNVLYWR